MEYTPGPWHAKVDSQPVPFRRRTRYGYMQVWPKDQRYGKVVEKVGGDTPAMKAANARLIAAAPELLSACKMALARESAQESLAGNGDKGLISMLRAAIAKANSLI